MIVMDGGDKRCESARRDKRVGFDERGVEYLVGTSRATERIASWSFEDLEESEGVFVGGGERFAEAEERKHPGPSMAEPCGPHGCIFLAGGIKEAVE